MPADLGRGRARARTSLACQIAKWVIADDAKNLPSAHRMLPVLIEQNFDLDVEDSRDVRIEAVHGQIRDLTGEAEAPSTELVGHLLKKQRILVVLDGFSGLNEDTRKQIQPRLPRFAVIALVITSRREESLGGAAKTIFHPLRLQHDRLFSFMEAYLQRCGKRGLFNDRAFFEGCGRLAAMVADRPAPPLGPGSMSEP